MKLDLGYEQSLVTWNNLPSLWKKLLKTYFYTLAFLAKNAFIRDLFYENLLFILGSVYFHNYV